MAMAAGCSICSDSLFKTYRPDPEPGLPVVNLPNNVNAMVTPCGHAYHAYCITRWMAGSQLNSGSCPNCRKPIPLKKCSALFLDTCDVTLNESSLLPGDLGGDLDGLRRELATANQKYEDCKAQRDSYKEQVKDIGETMRAVSSENENLVEQLANEKLKSDRFMLKYQEAASYKSFADQKERELKNAEDQLRKFTYVQAVLDGVRQETDRDLRNFTDKQKSITTLIQVKNVLIQELETLKESNKKEQSERGEVRVANLALRRKYEALKKEKESLELIVEGNARGRAANMAPPGGSKEKNPKKPAPKKPRTDLNDTIDISSDVEVEDKEVGLLKRIGAIRRNASGVCPGATKRAVRTSSMTTRTNGTRLNNDSEPLSPLNLRCKSGIPGLAQGDVMGTQKLGVGAAGGSGKSQAENLKRMGWKR